MSGPTYSQMRYQKEPSPRFLGSMPRDGASGIIRNAFVAVGLDVGKEGLGLDLKTVTEENIKLYPQNDPSSPIKSFLSSSQIPLNITLEPLHVLAPNTTYVFEISDSVKDLSGRPFPGFKITFTTSDISQPKFISMKRAKPKRIKGFRPKNDPEIIPLGPVVYAEPNKQTVEVAKTATEASSGQAKEDPQQASSLPKESSISLPESQSAPIVSAETTPEQVISSPAVSETDTQNEEAKPIAAVPVEEKSSPKVEPKEEEKLVVKAESIDFPKTRIKSGAKLPITFHMHEKRGVKYMIKNPAGKIVKRGASTLAAGQSGKGIDIRALVPGKYRISVKVEEKIVHHTFMILEKD